MKFRMQAEYKVELTMSPLDLKVARWIRGDADPAAFQNLISTKLLHDREGRPVLLFDSHHTLRWIEQEYPDLELAETGD